ncbi:MAG: PAS domain-containing protein, partial [Phycisphaerae bacterium]|nr:PAS domain-containing protein [Phycisphaerae bacterium]
VDYVLPVEQMPQVLMDYARQPYVTDPSGSIAPSDRLLPLLAMFRAHTKYDFRCYRKSMLMRRVERRMGLGGFGSLNDYVDHLREHAEEVTSLYKDLLIGVTGFFREPQAYEVLQQRVIPGLVEQSDDENPVRVWIPGCATGEEAYSIAIMLLECFASSGKPPNIQIFATDLDSDSLARAREGTYSDSVVSDVSVDRLNRFFVRLDDHHYQVNKQLRESVVFAPQNLISDAPFSNLGLVSCRNLLIYLEPDVQRDVIAMFHFALNDGGHLLLGSSETIGRRVDMFEPVSKKWRVYRRIGPTRRELVNIPVQLSNRNRSAGQRIETRPPGPGLTEVAQRILLADFAPASVLINRKYEILYFQGPTVQYLQLPSGEPTQDLLAMARQGLRTKIRTAVHRALKESTPVVEAQCRVKRDGHYVGCRVHARPIMEPKEAEGLLLVSFEDATDRPPSDDAVAHLEPAEESAVVAQLESELKIIREDLQSTIEELESSSEEMKASNEEVMSMNEELQSANEELETSKEELQSLNEELSTVNSQLQDKVAELDIVQNDLTNLLHSTDIATLFLDTEMRIKSFTPATSTLMNLLASDAERPIQDIALKYEDERLVDDARDVLRHLSPVETEVAGPDNTHFLRRILPYRTEDNRIEGVVVTFTDISARKNTERMVEEARVFSESVVEVAGGPLVVLDCDHRVILANRAFCDLFGLAKEETIDERLSSLSHGQWNTTEIQAILKHVLQPGDALGQHESEQAVVSIGEKTISLSARLVGSVTERAPLILLTLMDVTDYKKGQDALVSRLADHTAKLQVAEADLAQESGRTQIAEGLLAQARMKLAVAEEHERKTLAEELHDGIGQMLAVARLRLYESAKGSDPVQAAQSVEKAAEIIEEANQVVRTMTFRISPPVLHELGLVPAIEWLAEECEARYQLTVNLDEVDTRVSVANEGVRAVLFRAIRELLINVSKHSGVDQASINIHRNDGLIHAAVSDRGVGFDATRIQAEYGHLSIREGLRQIGGTLTVESKPGLGTTVAMAAPDPTG